MVGLEIKSKQVVSSDINGNGVVVENKKKVYYDERAHVVVLYSCDLTFAGQQRRQNSTDVSRPVDFNFLMTTILRLRLASISYCCLAADHHYS